MTGDIQHIGEPIAIVGSACRFPGDATTPSKLWDLLKAPRDVLSEIPESRFSTKAFYHPDGLHHGTTNVRHSYLLSDDHRLFDAQFFGTKPVEANSIDPQQRLLLETVYEGLETSGIPMEKLQGSNTAVYVGLMTNDYADMLGRDVQNFPTYFASGTARSILSNRVSYFFDWRGPSMTIDTACSSSLVALHQAVQSLRSGETDVAVAAGTNLLLGPEQYIAESKLKMLSPTGRSRMWDKGADGYARGDGIAAVILKPLSAALADGDHIECIVRETGANQDGRTKGITMPNPMAQAELIRTTYARAGLDLSKPTDRPQYFEAHGTGTPAGDPVEAEAISTAFFGQAAKYQRDGNQEDPLYVGSIKTVIGHTEGTAGLAAVLKASLALQHAVIPPNLLLNELSSTVRPFYNDLQILQVAKEWPRLPENTPRRASVNSFGFGGANAHAILEGFDARLLARGRNSANSSSVTVSPFNFSASSEKSLLANIAAYSGYLRNHSDVNIRDLSWTLNSRRSTLPVRLSVSASSPGELAARLDEAVGSSKITPSTQTGSIRQPKLLGVFTGQGAQWARMGAELLESSPMVSDCIALLDRSLQELPTEHRPIWSLRDELVKDKSSSRIGEAAFSQPLCTAVQITLVQLLRAANLKLTAVVGHSSGEIAAAYAAGYVNEEDAIRIAYYRGWSLQYANDKEGQKGAMMAAGTSYEDAKELCEMPSLENRICVAASNSSASVTLSGDADAIEEAREILEDEKKFARMLKVDKAYHSHHMLSCSAPYIAAIRKCGVAIQRPPSGSAIWISSVYGDEIENVKDNLADTYWSNNMVNPVLFSQAVTYAVAAAGPFDMALEIGPHPALKGPAMQTIQEVSGQTLPYTGTLNRGKNDTEALSSALGALWIALGESVVDFAGFEMKAMQKQNTRTPQLIKGLPSYSWDHDRVYWHESRSSTAIRTEKEPFHSLLGVKCPDGTDNELRWRNYLHPREVSWLSHHQVQGQMVFPAAGYISAAVEAVMKKYGLDSVQLIDFHDVVIGQALVLEENGGVETIFRLSVDQVQDNTVSASFACHSDANKGSSNMSLHASATLQIILGDPKYDIFPPHAKPQGSFLELEGDRFYNSVSELGFGYTGPFQALSNLRRKMDEAAGLIAVPVESETEKPLIIHPASLDGAIQSIMLAYSFPGDGRLRTLYLPTRIDRLRINPSACVALGAPGAELPFYSAVTDARFAELSGDVDMFSADGRHTLVQLEGLHTTPLSPLTSTNDVPFFTEVIWDVDRPTLQQRKDTADMLPQDRSLGIDLERVAHFYLKKLEHSLQDSDRANATWNHKHLLSYVEHCTTSVANGEHKFAKPEWANDTMDNITPILNSHSDSIDIKALRAVGENLSAVIRGDINLLEILMQDDMLAEFYTKTLGIDAYLDAIAQTGRQIGHRYPHVNVLEIGAGAGATSDRVMRAMGSSFASYTFTDILDSQFDDARERFSDYQSRMAFKALDIEKDIEEQGYEEACFDLVIAPLALYATRNLEATLTNVRRLLKPGGYLVMLELTDSDIMRFGLILGGLPGWWLGYEEGRTLSPCVSEEKWEALMQKAGLSGFEALAPSSRTSPLPFSVMVTQAVDHRVNFLRDPVATNHMTLGVDSLTIIGGKTPLTADMVADITTAVRPHYSNIYTASSLGDLVLTNLPVMGSVISLIELDRPVLKNMSSEDLKSFQELFKQSKNVLWLGHGAQGENPYGNMFSGVQRTLAMEMTHLHIHFLNFHSLHDADAHIIATKLLHLEATEIWDQSGQLDGILWSNERELMLENGQFKVPRFRLNSGRNDRYNSSRRLIIKEVERAGSVVTIQPKEIGYQIEEKDRRVSPSFSDNLKIDVTHSLLRAVRITPSDNSFLVLGKNTSNGDYVIALSHTLDSQVSVPHGLAVRCGDSESLGIRSMITLYFHFLALSMLQQLQPGKTLAVLDPDFSLSPVLTKFANEKGVQLVLLTTKEGHCSWPWIRIHQNSTRRELLSKLPGNISRLVNMGGSSDVTTLLKTCLPVGCHFESETTLTANYSQSQYTSDKGQLAMQLQNSWNRAQYDLMPVNMHKFVSLGLQDLIRAQSPLADQSLIAWGESQFAVQVRPATKQVKFSKDKTYWLVGLTGGLGLSLCEWMIGQGARYIAISSRNPKIGDEWLQRMAANGCTVRVFSNDITNRESVQATYRNISATMPPVAGVAQGAMVLQDTMFIDLDLPRLEKVLGPKVEGSILLDELFPEDTLDFMVFFSSMAAMTGNPGQVAYNAANMFMASLAAQRRNRGLAGHAINIGAIVGNGYVTRELNMGQQSYLYRVGHTWMSEQDFHEVFAEGVLTCLERVGSAELCCGLRIDDDESKSWISNPIFQHLVYKSSNLVVADKKGKSGVLIKTRLFEATSNQEVIEILQDGFLLKLQSALQADPSKPMLDMSPDELGVDSLVAVDLRSWFLKELGVDMPVLKIFNAASIRELLATAAETLPQALIPNFILGEQAIKPPGHQSNPPVVATAPPADLPVDIIVPETRASSVELKFALPDATNAYSGSSATSLITGDSNSEKNDDTSSSVFTDDGELGTSKREIQRTVPMSYGQSRFWFLEHLIEDKTAFNITPTFELFGHLKIHEFANAIHTAGQHHEALRTFFFTDNEQNHMQGVWTKSSLHLEQAEISDEIEVEEATKQMKAHVFNLSDGEIMRVQLLSLNQEKHWIIFGFHHINMDGISFEVFWSDVEKAYQGQTLSEDGLQYPDFTMRQLREYEEGAWAGDLSYWRAQYKEVPPALPLLPFALQHMRPKVAQFGSHTTQIRLDASLSGAIDRCCRMFKSTPFHFYLAIWKTLLLRFFDLKDVSIGLGDGNRTEADVLRSMGLFLNLLPVRFSEQPGQSFGESLKEVRNITQGAFAHSRVPFDVILTELNVPRSASHNPLCQTLFNYRPKVEQSRSFCGCVAAGELLGGGETSFDLGLDVGNVGAGETLIHLTVQKTLYGIEHAEILLSSYVNLLQSFVQNPATRVTWPALHSNDDIQEAVAAGRGPELREEWSMTIVHRLDEVASRYPDRVALKNHDESSLTYAQVQRRIDVIANELLCNGAGTDTRVAVFQSPSADWICSLMAILRVGGAYIPLDKKVGMERLAVIMKETQAPMVLVDTNSMSDCALLRTTAKLIDVSSLRGSTARAVRNMAVPSQTAVIMYTSGSTGVPKGIMIAHSAYAHHVQSSSVVWTLKQGTETILHQSSYAWDASLWQIMVSLCSGATLVIACDLTRGDPVAITRLIASENVTCTLATPTEYLGWVRHGRSNLTNSRLSTAVCGGEFMSNGLIKEIKSLNRPDLKLINGYGPAEISIACSGNEIPYHLLDSTATSSAQALYTLPNYSVYIVDESLNPVPIGVPGEVVVGGAGVAQGYLDGTKTTERFSNDRYASKFFREKNWTTIHRTGDHGKLNQDGGLILLGRMDGDNQIKLRGIRINIEEIETTIVSSSAGAITQAVVSVRSDATPSGDQFLVAFATMATTHDSENALQYLTRLSHELPLPPHMRPAAIIPVESIPQNTSGKTDRVVVSGLPIPLISSKLPDDNTLTQSEQSLRQLWQQALPRELTTFHSIDSQSDFFHVGGSSLALVNLQALIKEHLGVSMELYQLFEASSLRAMTARIQDISRPAIELDVNWDTEVEVAPGLTSSLNYGGTHIIPSGVKTVVLTGATGFFGKEILRGLIEDEKVSFVHCLAVRKRSSDLPGLFAHPKVHLHYGDLGAPQLGLSESEARSIFSCADIIVHNGADVSFMKTYQTLKLINVASTKELVKLALPRRIPFHFVSSAGVARLAAQESFGEMSLSPFPPPSQPTDGYIAAKWVSEVYLERINSQFGLPVWIHRPSSITGTDAPELDLMGNVMRFAKETQKLPDSSLWSGVFDLISVQLAASQLLEAVHQSSVGEPAAKSVTYLYESGETKIGRDEIMPLMESGSGQHFQVVSLDEWVNAAEQAGMSVLLGEYLRRASDGQVLLPRLIKSSENE
ncbi:Acyl transferase/acyl hydrolase/lysophospholipase [Penicillium concentricum]|uniref:Acyl transferase/acyl hydrolase/lysophospholipase n=1 Tax=Penicillium concentricum TaxID=293559 RepID=A0A9W9VCH9_9EURO|nr:Acyl transferase/acyl hydrolase/lysophospholipase [Penicillium concentricum]KAJ5374411.1 Acyl transferase/acyl hydrolase/lysophospholipase [Penicillium concentricum]